MIEKLENKIGYKFKDKTLLKLALTHSSCGIQENGNSFNNERLEFLGDAVLKLVIAEHLFKTLEDCDEGILSKMISQLVSGKTLAEEAKEISLSEHLFLGKGEESSGGRSRPRILAGSTEAIIGAIYLDGSLEAAKSFILKMIEHRIEPMLNTPVIDAKTQFQECIQKNTLGAITYNVVEQIGPAHNPFFKVELLVGDECYAIGEGKSKRQAEQEAAKKGLLRINERKNEK